jgi:hypothetical protein
MTVAAVLLALSVSGLLVTSTGASADAPVAYGWWSQTSLGAGASPTAPDVPADGMFVQNFPSMPGAVSALEFQLPSERAAPTTMTLKVTGAPIITQPPLACLATSRFDTVQNGAWRNRPTYDCNHAVTGVVSADQKQLQFAVDPLVRGQTLSLVVVAGGPVDRIAMTKPDFNTLSLTPSDASGAAQTPPSPATAPSEPLPASPSVTEAPLFSAPALPDVPSVGQPSAAQPSAQGQAAPPAIPAARPAASAHDPALDIIGLLLLLLGIVYWSDGFGALPLRSSRVVQRARRKQLDPAATRSLS